jgi:hypothetical protein
LDDWHLGDLALWGIGMIGSARNGLTMICGSPFAIRACRVNPESGTEDFQSMRGMTLMLVLDRTYREDLQLRLHIFGFDYVSRNMIWAASEPRYAPF